jgi:LysR family hydrogen peroxide-inducible transcriptional activator
MMTLQQVHYFLILCDEQNFSRAAARCEVKQPSLTNAIKQLERELGGPLFVRSRRMSRLSRLGAAVKPHLAAVEHAATAAKRDATVFLAAGGPPAASQAESPLALQAKGECHA